MESSIEFIQYPELDQVEYKRSELWIDKSLCIREFFKPSIGSSTYDGIMVSDEGDETKFPLLEFEFLDTSQDLCDSSLLGACRETFFKEQSRRVDVSIKALSGKGTITIELLEFVKKLPSYRSHAINSGTASSFADVTIYLTCQNKQERVVEYQYNEAEYE